MKVFDIRFHVGPKDSGAKGTINLGVTTKKYYVIYQTSGITFKNLSHSNPRQTTPRATSPLDDLGATSSVFPVYLDAEYKAETKAEYKAETKAEYKAETKAEYKAGTKAEYKAETQAEYKAETKAEYTAFFI
ncbi:hypothetical protein QYM36_011335 [Artemia franciscana]|uniref:Uncharacterized protein n=1 Tax=Artemia franciscana TaxID=6661 RepID=A0AA88HYV1_ARTSF|nr:hypothetical protein QYM36_011335 [Artemia franciscana]